MALVAFFLSLLLAALGALGVGAPRRFVGIVRYFETPKGLYVGAVLRLVLGATLLLAAPASRAPVVLPYSDR